MIATYNDDGTIDVMNAAWGTPFDTNQIELNISDSHRTTENIRKRKAFSVSLANVENMVPADYVGMVSAKNVKDKFERTGLHAHNAETVNAPVIEEFPLCMECEFDSVDDFGIYFFKIKKITADESVLDEKGNLDLAKCDGVLFDVASGKYYRIGEYLAKAFSVGAKYKK